MATVRAGGSRRAHYATSRGFDRVVFFTDAISAIAITLLVLPLVDLVPESSRGGTTPLEFLGSIVPELLSFVLSFGVIARLWYAHHQIFEHVSRYTTPLAVLSVFWSFTIVLLPLPTAMTAEFPPSSATVAFYIGTMFACSLALTLMALLIRSRPDIQAEDNPMTRHRIAASLSTTTIFGLALAVGVLVPVINYWALLLLLLSGPVESLLRRILPADRT